MKKNYLTNHLRTWWEGLKTSYWFIPAWMMALSCVLAYFCLSVLKRASIPQSLLSLFPITSVSGTSNLISTIASASITATSIAFSMTLVALTMATSQFGPRLLRTFMDDKGTQVVLGILTSSFLFCLIGLHQVGSITENSDALSIMAAMALLVGVLDTCTIIYFIHHIARFIQADETISRCYNDFLSNLDTLLPKPETKPDERAISPLLIKAGEYKTPVVVPNSGYLQTINYSEMLSRKVEYVVGIEVNARCGDYVMDGDAVLILHSIHPLPDVVVNAFVNDVVLGARRTPIQDPEFAISQLVEIALRALSPGINDPFTAITCLDRLSSACIVMSDRTFPAPCVINTNTERWLKRRTFSLHSVINKAFDQIRQAGQSHVAIILHILFCLNKLRGCVPSSMSPLIDEQAASTRALAMKHVENEKDLREIEAAYKAAL